MGIEIGLEISKFRRVSDSRHVTENIWNLTYRMRLRSERNDAVHIHAITGILITDK